MTEKSLESIVIKARSRWELENITIIHRVGKLLISDQIVKKSPSTVSLYLSQIVADGLVEIKVVELKKRYHIKVRELVDKLVEEHRPGSLEKSTSGFEDIINSF